MGLAMQRAETYEDGVEFQERYLRYRDVEKLKPRLLWSRQRAIVRSVEANDNTSVKGCHGSGKSFGAGGIGLHWIMRYQQSKVVVVAPTLRQVKNLIGEIELARRDSRFTGIPEATSTSLILKPDRGVWGVSASHGVNIQGYHSPNMLILVDEAPGVIEEVYDAIHGIRASGKRVRMLKLGNPVVPSGDFFNDFGKNKKQVKGITISAFDTPNLYGYTLEQLVEQGDKAAAGDERAQAWMAQVLFPTITRQFVYERFKAWGPKHPKFISRVLGEFPTQSDWAVFSLEQIERAKLDPSEEQLTEARGHKIRVGIDVAGGGDAETVLYARVDGIVLEMRTYMERDAGGKVIQDLFEIKRKYAGTYEMGAVLVDIVGPGLHLAPRIAQEGYEVYGFQAGGKAVDSERFENAKAEAYWISRDYFADGLITGLADDETEAQLSVLEYRETTRGKTLIESKPDMRDRLGNDFSPDRAEALIMALLPITPRTQVVDYTGDRYHISPV